MAFVSYPKNIKTATVLAMKIKFCKLMIIIPLGRIIKRENG